MKRIFFLLLLLPLSLFASNVISEENISYSHFGLVHIFRNQDPPQGVVIYISGDGALNRAALNMARPFADMNVIVIGVDYVHFMRSLNNSKEKCLYPAGDFENLSMFVQKKLKLTKYFKPILVGFSSGATLAYALLAQAPANTFKGAIGIGFCPDVISTKPFCTGNGLMSHVLKQGKSFYLDRYEKLTAPFIVFQGERDLICDQTQVNAFLKGMKNTEIYNLPNVGHGFAVQSKWMPQMKEAVKKIIDMPTYGNRAPIENAPGVNNGAISQLPLYLINAADNSDKPLCILISGDGGWTDFDQSIAETLAKNGISCVGLDTQKYFWETKTPDQTASDISKVLFYYLHRLQKTNFMLVGYSFGADVIPFIANRLPGGLKNKLSMVAMLSPDDKTDFEVTISSMLDLGTEDTYDVLKEIKKVNYTKKLCIFGSEEDDEDLQKSFRNNGAEVTVLNGSHHYDENYPLIVSTILKHL